MLERLHDAEIQDVSADYLFNNKIDSLDDVDIPEEDVDAEEKNYQYSVTLVKWERAYIIFCVLLLILNGFTEKLQKNKYLVRLLLLPFIYLFTYAVCTLLNGGKGFSNLAIYTQSARWGSGLLLWFVCAFPNFGQRQLLAMRAFAGICISLTFATHGWEAFNAHPPFQDLLLGFFSAVGLSVTMPTLLTILKTIAIKDFIIATLVLVRPFYAVLLWMTFWGTITAFSRPLTLGMNAWYMAATRAPNALLPLCLLIILIISKKAKEGKNEN